MVMEAVNFLWVKDNGVDYNPEVWDFYVDMKGHCWVVNKRKKIKGVVESPSFGEMKRNEKPMNVDIMAFLESVK